MVLLRKIEYYRILGAQWSKMPTRRYIDVQFFGLYLAMWAEIEILPQNVVFREVHLRVHQISEKIRQKNFRPGMGGKFF